MKVYTDEAARRDPGLAGYGHICRTSRGFYKGCFGSYDEHSRGKSLRDYRCSIL